jgi:hypothetical protein
MAAFGTMTRREIEFREVDRFAVNEIEHVLVEEFDIEGVDRF